jgi:hypothetical protein
MVKNESNDRLSTLWNCDDNNRADIDLPSEMHELVISAEIA